MPQVANTVKSVKNIRFKVGATDTYELHVNNVTWSKNTTTTEWIGGTADAVYSDSVVTSHICAINLAKDYQNEDSLFNWMIDHEGETVAIEYRPDPASDFVQTATITVVAPDTGGAMRQYHEQTVNCPSTKPVRTFTAPA